MSASDHRLLELLTPDHLPACPDCGDLWHPGATVCESCGAHLTIDRRPVYAVQDGDR